MSANGAEVGNPLPRVNTRPLAFRIAFSGPPATMSPRFPEDRDPCPACCRALPCCFRLLPCHFSFFPARMPNAGQKPSLATCPRKSWPLFRRRPMPSHILRAISGVPPVAIRSSPSRGPITFDDPRHAANLAALTPIHSFGQDRSGRGGAGRDTDALQALIAKDPSKIIIQTGPTLTDQLPPEVWTELSTALANRGIPAFMAAKFKPWYVIAVLSVPPCADGRAEGRAEGTGRHGDRHGRPPRISRCGDWNPLTPFSGSSATSSATKRSSR
jgi:hypothetical protein